MKTLNPRRKIVVYTAGPYNGETHREISKNIQVARGISVQLWQAGFTVLCPHLNTIHFERDCKCEHEDYIEGDLIMLARCDAVFMLKDWQQSSGAVVEQARAKHLGKPVFHTVQEIKSAYPIEGKKE